MINEPLDKKLLKFFDEHHLLTVSSSVNGIPYSFHCFYVYLEEEQKLVYTSSEETKHVQDFKHNDCIAAAIGLETKDVTKIQGVQIVGRTFQPEGELKQTAEKKYLKRFPYAKLMKTNLWVVDFDFIKMTDNRLGFGKKLIYGELPQQA